MKTLCTAKAFSIYSSNSPGNVYTTFFILAIDNNQESRWWLQKISTRIELYIFSILSYASEHVFPGSSVIQWNFNITLIIIECGRRKRINLSPGAIQFFFLESHNENVIYFVNIEALGSDAINHASHYKN